MRGSENRPQARGATAIVALAASVFQGCVSHSSPADRALFEQVCSQCHSLEIPLKRNRDFTGWKRTVDSMRQRGARLNDEEAERVARYLARIRPRR